MESTHVIDFTPYSKHSPNYDIFVRAEPGTDVPQSIAEDERGAVYCLTTSRHWDSLSQMTHELRIEIVRWASDAAN